MATIKAVGFNWGGTLVNTALSKFEVTRLQIQRGGGNAPSRVKFLETYESPHMEYLRRYGSNISEEDSWKIWEEVLGESKPVTMHLGVPALVERFARSDIRCYIVTANPLDTIHRQLNQFHMTRFFSGIYAKEESKEHGICSILENCEIKDPREMFYFGDMRIDMHAAKKTGVTGIGIASMRGHEEHHSRVLREAGATHAFYSLSDFHDALIRGDV